MHEDIIIIFIYPIFLTTLSIIRYVLLEDHNDFLEYIGLKNTSGWNLKMVNAMTF